MSNEILDQNSQYKDDERPDLTANDADENTAKTKNRLFPWIITAGLIGLFLIAGMLWILTRAGESASTDEASAGVAAEEDHSDEEGEEVRLEPGSLESFDHSVEEVTLKAAVTRLFVTGAVELNQETTEMATPLVGGRIEKVFVGVGDHVKKGDTLALISSPQLAQMHGKMHEAKTQYELAVRNLDRVQRSENRVAVLTAKAKLDEAQATLNRTKKLIELGAGAGKDLIAAEAAYQTAKAEYEFQTNISLNKEIQEAKAAVETLRIDLRHIQDEMRSLGLTVSENSDDDHDVDTSLVALRSPVSGMVIERRFNAGAGIDAAVPVFVISDLSTVYVIANVPEANMSSLRIGSNAEIRSQAIGTLNGRVGYIDPRLDETTRTVRVRVEVPNTNGKLRAGMFTEVAFYTGVDGSGKQELFVRTEAIQQVGGRSVVFIPKSDEPGSFEVRTIQIGGEADGYTGVISGLELGEKVVTKGSFVLKAQLQKGEMGDHGH